MDKFTNWILNEENDFMRDNLHFIESTEQIDEMLGGFGGLNPGALSALGPYAKGKKDAAKEYFDKGKEEGIEQANRNFRGDVEIQKAGRGTISQKNAITGKSPTITKDNAPRRLTKPIRSISSQAMAIASAMRPR